MRKRVLVWVSGFLAASVGLAGLLWGMAWLMQPDMSARPPAYSPEELRAVEQARRPDIDPDNPPVLYRYVDYSEGPSGRWYPKGESPVLAELVRRGELPPVAERVGPEPAVVEGVEGIGRYGGTWIRAGSNDNDVFSVIGHRMSAVTLVRWSPQGYPLVPHVARAWEVSDDYRTFTFTLRRGMKWSDGHPFTADDIMYWWRHEVNDKMLSGAIPTLMKIGGQPGTVEKIDDLHVRFRFPKPNGLFLIRLATPSGMAVVGSPAHYLRKYHPRIGDKRLIREMMRARNLASPLAVYRTVKQNSNPEHPRLWPWVYRTHRPTPPYTFVRNPYFWMVDTEGNQLPYVDRVHFEVKSPEMIGASAANGQITMQARHLRYNQYTLLMGERRRSGYDLLHWYPGDRSDFVVSPNLNRRVDPARPQTRKKRALLNEKKFRQALSLAIDRRAIIQAEYNGQTEPAQVDPGPLSRFHEPALYHAYTAHDVARANRLLDELGLTRRDYEGYRTFPDGSRMQFYLNICGFVGAGPAQFLIEDWKKVGVRVVLRARSRQLWSTEGAALEHDLTVWTSDSEFLPLLAPRYFLPVGEGCTYAQAYARWYDRGGLHGDPLARGPGCEEPPPDHPLREAMRIYEQVRATGDLARQVKLFRRILRIAAENVWTINICTAPPALVVVKNGFHNVPRNVVTCWNFLTPGNAGIETYYFENPTDSPGAIRQIRDAIRKVTPPPDAPAAAAERRRRGGLSGTLVRLLCGGIAVLAVVGVAVRHPYIARRLLIMIPTLAIISVIVFTIIQLPPGDYLTSRIMELRLSGDEADLKEAEELRELFHLDEPMPARYARWLGLRWFLTFDAKDTGLLQGNLGLSMGSARPVNDIVGDRILLTVLISLGTIVFTWALAIPTGIYSAVRQYSPGDYLFTFIGFIGMCFPSFLLALVVMYFSKRYLGIEISGLFSSQYGAQPEWDWAKVVDLSRHIWVPVVVLGVGGTAGMIRVMRGNLLDELRKPYVVTARAKGVRPTRLLLKYPVRLALNPFISGIGALFPQLVSGGAIVAMVLSLPTVGPLMLEGLMTEDFYLAGSMLMVLSLLGVFGTLVSDLLLLWLDPRIRFKGTTR